MKKLFSDTVVSKLRVLPAPVWVLFVYVSFFFANAYQYLIYGEYVALATAEAYAELGYNFNTSAVGIIMALLQPLVSLAVFEIVLGFTYGSVVGRFRANVNRSDYKFRARYLAILINLVVGVLSIGYFFTQTVDGVPTPDISLFAGFSNYLQADNPYYTIQSLSLSYVITSVFCVIFFEDFRVRFVPHQNQAPLFGMFASIYLGVYALVFAYDLLATFVLYTDVTVTTYDIVAYALRGGFTLLSAVGYYLYYRKLKNSSDDGVSFEIIPPDNSSGSEKIFDDFDF